MREAPTTPQPPAAKLNEYGYPQLVQSNRCALCKERLQPLNHAMPAPLDLRPTFCATEERLQCERCGLVRYCSAWCAHVHYITCHRRVCPLPQFSSDFNAEYVERRGAAVVSIPIRAIRTELMDKGGFPNVLHRINAARTHVWTMVQHQASASVERAFECEWCTRPLTNHSTPYHNVWFVALITRIRHAKHPEPRVPSDWPPAPLWIPPLTVYSTPPLMHGDPVQTWPEPDEHARWPNTSED